MNPKPRTFSPSEFSAALAERGVIRSERWVQDHCKSGEIKTLDLPGRYLIPGAELDRLTTAKQIRAAVA